MIDRSLGRPSLGIDSLLLLAMLLPTLFLGPALFLGRGDAPRMVLVELMAYGLTVAYLLVGTLQEEHSTYRIRRFLLALLISVVVILPLFVFIIMRHRTGPQHFVHDNPLQIEEAARLLAHGVNPYGHDYSGTAMGLWGYTGPRWSINPSERPPADWDVNPALSHVVSLPFGLLIAVPFYLIGAATIGWWDARVIYGLAYLVVLWLIGMMVRDREQRLTALILVGLNPLLVPFLIEGRNDILVFSLLLGSALAWQRDRRTVAGILLGLAMSTKHVAIFMLPFWVLLGWPRDLPWRTRVGELMRHLLIPGGVVLTMILPFLVWNTQAFLDDTVGYLAGWLPTSYPLTGIGVAGTALVLGLVPNAAAPFPATLLQAVTAGPLLLILLWRQWHDNSMRQALLGYGLFLLVYMYFGRMYADNYLGMIALVLISASYWPAEQASRVPQSIRPDIGITGSDPMEQTRPDADAIFV